MITYSYINEPSIIDFQDSNNDIDTSHTGKITRTGKIHMVFDSSSFMENCVLVITGAYYIYQVESNFYPVVFCCIVIGTHLMGLLLKCVYYCYQHPWMSSSKARKPLENCLKVVFVIIGLGLLIGLPIIGYHLPQDSGKPSTISIVLYILTVFLTLFVSTINLFS